jgi:hypothetical protein
MAWPSTEVVRTLHNLKNFAVDHWVKELYILGAQLKECQGKQVKAAT